MANANIFQQYLQPVKTVADFNAEADGQDLRRQQLIGAQRQNALAALIAQQQTQQMADTAADRNALQRIASGWTADTAPDARIAALRNTGRPALMQQADTLEKQWLDRRKTDADIGKTSAETGKIGAETVDKVIGNYRTALDTIQSPQDAAQWLAAQYQDPALRDHMTRMAPLDAAISKIPTDPQGFMAWKQQAGMGMEKYAAFVAPKPVETRLGNRVAFVDMNPNSPTYKQQVAGAAIAQSPDNAAQVAATMRGQNLADARAAAGLAQADRHFNVQQAGDPANKATEGERNAAGYATRMVEATKLLDQFEGAGKPGYTAQIAGGVPLIGGAMRTAVMTPEQQQYRQAQEDWVRSKLRKESGASIGAEEMDREIASYFPQPGEDKATITQKRHARAVATEAMLKAAGRAGYTSAVPEIKPGTVMKFDAKGNLVP